VYDLAETYFVERLTAHFRPLGYECFPEYAYAGGSKFMPNSPTVSHTNADKARILRMLQGGDDAFGFRFLKPKVVKGQLKDRGFQKPDFLAFRAHDGVVGEVGTARDRAKKLVQLNNRLVDLRKLVEEEINAHIAASAGQPVRWHGMSWRGANYHPAEGPVLFPVDDRRLISTQPTFEPKTDGLYLYQLLRFQRHRLPIGVPVALPRLSPVALEQLRDAWQRYQQPGKGPQGAKPGQQQSSWLGGWPALLKELAMLVIAVGIVAVVVAAMAALSATAPAAAAIAGFAAILIGGLSAGPKLKPGT
jgi:hypothetical protein